MPQLTIGLVATRAGVGVETIRFYERCGLIRRPPRPRAGGFRIYDIELIERVQFIRQAQELGFTLREIRELLSLRAVPATDCSAVRAQAIAKRDEVDRKMGQLGRMRRALDELIRTCPGSGALRSCTILEALSVRSNVAAARADGGRLQRPAALRRKHHQRQDSAMKTTILKIEGMHCEGCAQTIEFLVGREAGVRKVSVSLKEREARILHEPGVGEDRLAGIIKRAGFRLARHG